MAKLYIKGLTKSAEELENEVVEVQPEEPTVEPVEDFTVDESNTPDVVETSSFAVVVATADDVMESIKEDEAAIKAEANGETDVKPLSASVEELNFFRKKLGVSNKRVSTESYGISRESILQEKEGILATIGKAVSHYTSSLSESLSNFVSIFTILAQYDKQGLVAILNEIKDGKRVVKKELTNKDEENIRDILGISSLFGNSVKGDLKDTIEYLDLVIKSLDKGGWIDDMGMSYAGAVMNMVKLNKWQELPQDKTTQQLFSKLNHFRALKIDVKNDLIAAMPTRFFGKKLSIFSIVKDSDDGEKINYRLEADVIRDIPKLKIEEVSEKGIINLLEWGIANENRIKQAVTNGKKAGAFNTVVSNLMSRSVNIMTAVFPPILYLYIHMLRFLKGMEDTQMIGYRNLAYLDKKIVTIVKALTEYKY